MLSTLYTAPELNPIAVSHSPQTDLQVPDDVRRFTRWLAEPKTKTGGAPLKRDFHGQRPFTAEIADIEADDDISISSHTI